MIDVNVLAGMLQQIPFDAHYGEATFQFKLMMRLSKVFSEDGLQPERNIEAYDLNKRNFVKKEIDLVIESNGQRAAIELKMPMNGQEPEQMFKFAQDIQFLEQLKRSNQFQYCALVTVTNDSHFWNGRDVTGIYAPYRDAVPLTGTILKPTGKGKGEKSYTLTGSYQIQWFLIPQSPFRYFIVEVW